MMTINQVIEVIGINAIASKTQQKPKTINFKADYYAENSET